MGDEILPDYLQEKLTSARGQMKTYLENFRKELTASVNQNAEKIIEDCQCKMEQGIANAKAAYEKRLNGYKNRKHIPQEIIEDLKKNAAKDLEENINRIIRIWEITIANIKKLKAKPPLI